MMKIRHLPDYLCHSPLEIEASFFRDLGVKLILCDLDNTLAKAQSFHPEKEAIEWVAYLKDEGFALALASNGRERRIKTFAKDLDIPSLFLTFKPLTFRLRHFVKRLGYKPNEAILIGDQTYSDIKVAKKLGMKAILCEIVSKEEPKFTAFGRSRDKKARVIIKEKNLVPSWKENI